MMEAATNNTADAKPDGEARPLQMGRMFVHPLFDYMLIGGGLSLIVTFGMIAAGIAPEGEALAPYIPLIILLSNSSHFAASTVRLYTKPGAFRDFRFLTMALPLVTLAVLTASIGFAG